MTSNFTVRDFALPSHVLYDIDQGDQSLTEIMHAHVENLGDYALIKQWQKDLSYKSNWVGNTVPFNYVVDYHRRQENGETRYKQHMFLDEGSPVGFLRFLHLAQDTPTRRRDCTKIEESLVSHTRFLRNPQLFQAMYQHTLDETEEYGHTRVITELGVGLSRQNYNGITSRIKNLRGKNGLNLQETEGLEIAQRKLSTDWLKVTAQFIETIGFDITDIILPNSDNKTSTPQIRISKTIDGKTALPLPVYQQAGRTCLPYKKMADLNRVSDVLNTYKNDALLRYTL